MITREYVMLSQTLPTAGTNGQYVVSLEVLW